MTGPRTIGIEPLLAAEFAPFGDVLEAMGAPDMKINQDLCDRFHDKAALDFADGRAGISLFRAQPRSLPYRLEMMERHPLGTQAFMPMSMKPFLVIAANDAGDKPDTPRAFITSPGQGINFHRNVWHGVLTPLENPALFAVIDRIGEGNNLQEHWFDEAYEIVLA